MGRTFSLTSLVFAGLIEHMSFAADLDTDYDSVLVSSVLVEELAMVVGRETLVVWVMDNIHEVSHDLR